VFKYAAWAHIKYTSI